MYGSDSCRHLYYKIREKHISVGYILRKIESICDFGSFDTGRIYAIYFDVDYKMKEIKALWREYLMPEEIDPDVASIVFFRRFGQNEDIQEDVNEAILLQQRGLLTGTKFSMLDFIVCQNYRCWSMQKRVKNVDGR